MGDYLPAIFGQPAEPDDLYAEEISASTWIDPMLLEAAWRARSPSHDPSLPRHEMAKRVEKHVAEGKRIAAEGKKDIGGDYARLIKEMMPEAACYIVDNVGAQYNASVHFIIDGDRVFISGPLRRHARWPAVVQVAKGDALEAIYKAIKADRQAA